MARISDLLAAGPTYSFEFFPPKTDAEQATLVRTLRELEPLGPSFVSVTYRGGRESRQRTHDLVAGILRTTTITPMAHLICVAHTRLELADILVSLRKAGVENLMALGGDPPTDPGAGPGELRHAVELVELARAVGGFSIGVAAHPACHPSSPDRTSDRDHLAEKLRLADFAVTQFFWDFDDYAGLVADLAARGVDKPVLPGLMPVTTLGQIPRMAQMGGPLPPWAIRQLEEAGASGGVAAVRRAGIDMVSDLCRKLLDAGAPGLHFYTLNRSSATREIYLALGLAGEGASAPQ
ncbi:MAG: methylenetetrahydrofolate reductase [Acidimicrobiales bacterium]